MKKIGITLIFCFSTILVSGQVKLGLQISPSLSSNRVDESIDTINYSSHQAGVKFTAGLLADFILNENYYFSSGIFYVPKYVGIKDNRPNDPDHREEKYRLQYIRVPATLKLYTNELTLDTRLYFNVGVLPEIKIFEEGPDIADTDEPLLEDFGILNIPLQLGGGIEYRVGYNTLIYGGFSYQRGLINALAEDNIGNNNTTDLTIKNDMLSIDLGIKF